MAMTRSDMRTAVRENIKRQVIAFSDTKIDTRLDWGQMAVCDSYDFEEMRKIYTGPTVASQKRYGFPSVALGSRDMKNIFSLTLQDGINSWKMQYVPARTFEMFIPRPEAVTEGRPHTYVDYGKNFEVYFIPDAVYTMQLRCSVYVLDFASDSSTSELIRKDRCIIAKATALCFQALKEIEYAKYWNEEEYKDALAEAVNTDTTAEDWTPVARQFDVAAGYTPDYVSDPMVRGLSRW